MAITTVDGLVAAMTASTRQKIPIAKTAAVSATAGGQSSYWRSTGAPQGQGAIPAAAATCNNTTLGGIIYTNATSPAVSYIARLGLLTSVAGSFEVHDRLAHMGGLSGTVTTAQTVNIDLNALGATDNITARCINTTTYQSVQWWLEWYTATGATATTATIAYTNQNGTAGTCTVAVAASTPAGMLKQIIPTTAGDNIRAITSVTLAASTATAGSFGVTATVEKGSIATPLINTLYISDWAAIGLPTVYNSSCLFFIGDATAATVGTLGGSIALVQG